MSNLMFVPRLTAPAPSDLRWIKTTYGGYNRCVLGNPSYGTGSVLANCVGFCWGRWLELLNATNCQLSTGNADHWYTHSDPYQRGSAPRLGAIACWSGGSSGHVASVEKITATAITCSESAYNGYAFRVHDYDINMSRSGFTFQGFIYLPITYVSTAELMAIIKRRRRYGDL